MTGNIIFAVVVAIALHNGVLLYLQSRDTGIYRELGKFHRWLLDIRIFPYWLLTAAAIIIVATGLKAIGSARVFVGAAIVVAAVAGLVAMVRAGRRV